ncbi:hypothetical protein JCM15519_18880 [Fundidesulfovibrio butyratiphilus]
MFASLPSSTRMSRRTLFKALGLGGAAALVPARSRAALWQDSSQELVTFLNLNDCIGCGACVDACREKNADRYPKPVHPIPPMIPSTSKPEDFSDKKGDTSRLTPYNWLYIQTAVVETEQGKREVNIPRRCLHCQNPPCANLCPWGASSRQANGIVSINPDICLGGAKCRTVCPWHIPQRQSGVGLYLELLPTMAGNGVMYKCDRCQDRVAKGEKPACIEACPNSVQTIGPRREIVAMAKRLAAETGGYLYGLEENGGTNTIYLSPVPFETLNKAVEKGPGKPHLAKVADVMATSNHLAWAVLLAPLAGVASSVLKTGKKLLGKSEAPRD